MVATATIFAVTAANSSIFPLSASSNGRYLQSPSGTPFFLSQDAGWNAPILLNPTEVSTYLTDRANKGFTGCLVNAIDTTATKNYNNDQCFSNQLNGSAWNGTYDYSQNNTNQPDFTTANSAYFSNLANFVSAAATKNILVLLVPSYVGYAGLQEGWMTAMVQNDAVTGAGGFTGQSWANGSKSKMWNYGAYIGNLLKNYNNILWMLGGDYGTSPLTFTSPQETAVNNFLLGVKSVPGQSNLWSGHWNSPSISTDETTFASSINVNGCYAFDGTVVTEGRAGYAYSPTLPAYILELPYEKEGPSDLNRNGAATEPIRRYSWWGWLSSILSCAYGNGYIWDFGASWSSHTNDPGTQDISRLNTFAKSISWWKLVPSNLGTVGTLITSNGGTIGGSSSNYIAAAVTSDGSYLVAYIPPASSGAFSVDVSVMRGAWTAQWFDPTNASYSSAGSGSNSGTHSFTPPGTNAGGVYTDWVLLISA